MVESAAHEETKRPAAKEADLYSWAGHQAELLRAGRLSEIDAAAIAEEIDDVGEEQYDKLESAFRALMLHLLKRDHQPSMRSRSWTLTIREQRRRVERRLRKNPGLKSQVDEALKTRGLKQQTRPACP
jgi:hypothetical protein